MLRKSINREVLITLVVLSFGLLEGVKAQTGVAVQGGSPAMNYSRELLKRKDVQDELDLDAQQRDALAKVLIQSNRPVVVRPVVQYRDISTLSDEERRQWQAEINHQAAKQTALIMNERRRAMEEILRPNQRKRLAEIDLQWRGILALGSKSLSDQLGVSPAHHECIAQILADFEVKRLRLLSYSEKSEDTHSLRYQKRRALLQETEQKVLALLSDEEKSLWTQAVGKPFKFRNEFEW
jgi:hypothetical protein